MKNLNEIGKMSIDFNSWTKLVPVKEILEGNNDILFVDIRYSKEPISEENSTEDRFTMTRNPERSFGEDQIEEGFQGVVSADIFSKQFVLTKELNLEELRKDFLENVIVLSNNKNKETLEKFSITRNKDIDINIKSVGKTDIPPIFNKFLEDYELEKKMVLSKINNASNFIAVDGRIGRATNIVVSEENYHKYNLESIDDDFRDPPIISEADPFGEETWVSKTKRYAITIEDVDDIYLYNKNSIDQPGLILAHNEEKYEFLRLGFYPEKQFFKIILK